VGHADRRTQRLRLPDLARKDWTGCPVICQDRTLNQRAAAAILVGCRRPFLLAASACLVAGNAPCVAPARISRSSDPTHRGFVMAIQDNVLESIDGTHGVRTRIVGRFCLG